MARESLILKGLFPNTHPRSGARMLLATSFVIKKLIRQLIDIQSFYFFPSKFPQKKEPRKRLLCADVLKRYFVKQYGHIAEYYAVDKTALRSILYGRIEDIVEVAR